ncbi:MAG TPA: NAD(P)-dependent oxidoreductase [Acidimicrobiales bacterium]|jgi:nucleoside-diphosphate-sugar epimerase
MEKLTERFLVTGAAGCIGAWAIRLLLDEGVDVVASDVSEDLRRFRLISHPRNDDVTFVPLDVTATAEVARVVQENDITHVIHLAGLQVPFCAANPPLGAMVNVVGNVNVFDAIRVAQRRIGLAYASSAAVFGAGSAYTGGVVGDVSPLLPDTHYGVYKVANEGTARVYSLNNGIGSIGLRPFIVYGPGRDQGMTSDATKAILAAVLGEFFNFKFGGNMLLTYAPDCARAFIESARAAAGSGDALVLNVPGRRVGVAQLVAMIEELIPESAGLLSWETKPISAPALLSAPALGDVIDFVNTSLEDGVRATIEHFRRAVDDGILSSTPS